MSHIPSIRDSITFTYTIGCGHSRGRGHVSFYTGITPGLIHASKVVVGAIVQS